MDAQLNRDDISQIIEFNNQWVEQIISGFQIKEQRRFWCNVAHKLDVAAMHHCTMPCTIVDDVVSRKTCLLF